jgi:hypothetical protein
MLAAGCGGGGSTKATVQSVGRTINLATSPTLDDGSHYASVTFLCTKSGSATLKASSTALDPILVVEKLNSDGTSEAVAADDDSAGGTSALATFSVAAGSTYTAYLTSAGADAGGVVTVEYPADKLAAMID